jgi:hypothetical protein
MRSLHQMWTYLLVILCSALAIHSTPLYMNANDLQNSEGVIVRSEYLPSLFSALYDDSVIFEFICFTCVIN